MKASLFSRLRKNTLLAVSLCLLFFVAYSTLGIVRHEHFGSLGFDLGINDQVVWRYSTFQLPITTSDPFPFESKLVAHVELTYILLAPFYWIWSDARMLILLQAFAITFSGIAVYLLAKKHKLKTLISLSVLICFLMFYGVQNALWADAHSAVFAAAFLTWFIYFLDIKHIKLSFLFFALAILTKENIAILTFLTSLVYFLTTKNRYLVTLMTISIVYLLFVYLIYFPHLIPSGYLYQNEQGLFSNTHPMSLVDSPEKRDVFFYSLASFGFLPLLSPLRLLPILGDLATYFVLASDLKGSHGLFMHYRVTLVPLLAWATIASLSRFRILQTNLVAGYLLLSILVVQYVLHLPLSYLTKEWFWTKPSGVSHIETLIKYIPQNASVVSQNNITPHLSHRDEIFTLYPEKKTFHKNSPCGEDSCQFFRWAGNPTYLIVDTSAEWDIRHFLANRDDYIQAIENLEKSGIVTKYQTRGSASLYKINNDLQ